MPNETVNLAEIKSALSGLQAEIKTTFETMKGENERFKAENERRLKEIESKGRADPLTETKIEAHSVAVSKLEAKLQEMSATVADLQASAKRLGPGASEEDERRKGAEEREAFANRFLRPGALRGTAKSAGAQGFRAELSTDSNPDGGYLTIPSSVANGILSRETQRSPMRQVCTVVTVTNEEFEQLVDIGGAEAAWVGERESRPVTATPQVAKIKPYFGELEATPKTTQMMLDDSAYDVAGWLERSIGLKFGKSENIAFTSGDGSKKPKGFLGYSMAYTADSANRPLQTLEKIKSTSAGNFTIDPLIDVVHALDSMYMDGARWMLPTLALAKIRKLKSGDVYVYQPSMMAGEPAQLLGYPITINNDMPAPAADSASAAFGNFAMGYTIFDRKGITILRDPYTEPGAVKFYTTRRVGGGLMEDRAIKVHVLSA